ncbi:MAG: DNA-protecting protein DprA [Ignavibacteria bacterium]|nr:DNA-protecting protein DprA [Ignavibacteria bacterium]
MNTNKTSWKTEDILALSFVRGITATTLVSLVNNYGSIQELFENPPNSRTGKRLLQDDLFSKSGITALKTAAEKQLELCKKHSVDIYHIWDKRYPEILKQISYPPALIFVRGELESSKNSIGIVGTRQFTIYGKITTERFAASIAKNNCIVTSGLASGIDTIAHKAALASGGKTYAVIASGIDCISPQLSAKLAVEISKNGAVISEYRCGTKALPPYFPQRNRIISGLSRAVVVTESGMKGGSLITAQFAVDQSRELFAVPGNINSDKSEGTNMLIRKNMAIAAISPEDMLEELGYYSPGKKSSITHTFTHDIERRVYEGLSYEPIQMDDIAEKVKLSAQDVMVNLLHNIN